MSCNSRGYSAVAEVGMGYGYLTSNAESLSGNQQFCVKSGERGVKSGERGVKNLLSNQPSCPPL